jgi:hypothetical protein
LTVDAELLETFEEALDLIGHVAAIEVRGREVRVFLFVARQS